MMRGLMRRSAVLAGAVAVMLSSGMGIAAASPALPASGAPAWSITPTPSPPGGAVLHGVSCTSASACTAVGNTFGSPVTVAERWNGTVWAVQPTPNPSGATNNQLREVSCTSASACTAVGYYSDLSGANPPAAVAERWNGTTWAMQSIPTPTGGGELSGVSCPSALACTAVGYYSNSVGTELTLAERWNGNTWAIQHTPNPGGSSGTGALERVSCTSASACTATGTGTGGPLAERYGRSS